MSDLMVFRGQAIRERGEAVNLTDAWRAAGGDNSKRPAQWIRSKQAKGIVSALEVAVGISHSGLFSVETGGAAGGGATWAHWQLAMAYAQYLSPEFHTWCNDVVRAHMRRKERGVDVDVNLVHGPRMGDTPEGRERVAMYVRMVRASTGASTARIHGFIRRHAQTVSVYRVSSIVWDVIARLCLDLIEKRIPMLASPGPKPRRPKCTSNPRQLTFTN